MKMNINDKRLVTSNIFIIILGSIMLIVSALSTEYFDFQKSKTKETETIKRQAVTVASRFQTVMGSFYLTTKTLDYWISRHPDKDPRFDPEFNKLVSIYREQTYKQIDIRMVTAEGKIFYFPSKSEKPLADVKDREYYRAHVENNIEGIYFAEPVKSRVTGKWGIPVSYRLKYKNNIVFILFGAIEFTSLDKLFETDNGNYDGIIVLTRDDGKVLYSKPFDSEVVGKNISEVLGTATALNEEKNFNIIEKKGVRKRMMTITKVKGFPVSAVILENYNNYINDSGKKLVIKLIIIFTAIIIFIILNIRGVRLFKQLQEANETKDKFLAIIAHDLRGPIGTGALLLEITAEEIDTISKKELLETINEIKNSMKYMYELLENLLNWATLQKEQITVAPVEIETGTILSNCLSILKPIAKMKKIEIIYDSKESFLVFVDSQMIITVFRNLLSNSIKYTNEGGKININVISYNNNVEIHIKDTGVGMEKEKIEKLFKINERVSTLGTKNEKGTGLGLILSKEFLEKNGGKIYIKSEPGIGTEVSIVLPVKKSKM